MADDDPATVLLQVIAARADPPRVVLVEDPAL
jgi:hypothetical protein